MGRTDPQQAVDELEAFEARPHVVLQVGIARGELFDFGCRALLGERQVSLDRLADALVVVAGSERGVMIWRAFIIR